MVKEIEIPEGYDARIDGNKVIIERKESEDERIRKALLELVSNDKAAGYMEFYEARGITCDDAIAYLEKQKEQKPAEWCEEDANLLNRTLSIIRWASDSDRTNRIIGDEGAIELEDWLKSLRPSWKPSEKQMVALKNTMYDYKDAPYFQDLKYLYDDLKKL